MKLIHGSTIKEALKHIRPRRIAVAYVGKDWRTYVDPAALEEIVVSPTIGSNPRAILELAQELGWEHVHLLDNLHSKLYLGQQAAALGSFNLSANGLSATGLAEAGYEVAGVDAIAELSALFNQYKRSAAQAYPTTEDKLAAVARLELLWTRAIRNGVIRNDAQPSSLSALPTWASAGIYVCPVADSISYNLDNVSPGLIRQSLSFRRDDPVEREKWILCWTAKGDGYPDTRYKPYWIYIDEVVEDGAIDETYPQLAVEYDQRQALTPPFELCDKVVRALFSILRSNRFHAFLWPEDPWLLQPTLAQMAEFLAAVGAEVSRLEAAPVMPGSSSISVTELA